MVWVLWVHPPQGHAFSDMAHYLHRARELAANGPAVHPGPGTRDLVWQPWGTHTLLALPLFLFGDGALGLTIAALIWGLCSAATVILSHALARAALPATKLGPWPARIVGLLALAWIPHLGHAGYFVSEAPFTCALLATVLGLVAVDARLGRFEPPLRSVLGAGLAGAAAFALRPESAILMVFACLVLAYRHRQLRVVAALLAPLLALALASAARVQLHAGRPGIAENAAVNRSAGRCHAVVIWAVPDEATRAAIEAARERDGPDAYEAYRHLGRRVSLPGFRALARRGDAHPLALRPALAEELVFVGHIGEPEPHRALRRRCWAATGVLGQARYALTHLALLTTIARPWPESADHRSPWQLPLGLLGRRAALVVNLLAALGLLLVILPRRRESPVERSDDFPRIVCALALLSLAIVAVVFFGSPRLRAPYDPYALILAVWVVPAARRRLLLAAPPTEE